jgi:hypothetical protein
MNSSNASGCFGAISGSGAIYPSLACAKIIIIAIIRIDFIFDEYREIFFKN